MMKDKSVAFIVPVFNEAQVIEKVIKDIKKYYKYVVCVDDGSTDSSKEIILEAGAYLVSHPINMGQGAALQTGIEFARQLPVDYFVTFDADGQHSVDDVSKMLKKIQKEELDIVLGSRFLGNAEGINYGKKILLKMAISFTNFVSGVKLTDTHNGLRVFNRKVAETIQITMPDMAHASEIIDIINKKDYKYAEIPVTIKYTEYSKKKGQSLINAINIGFDTLLRKFEK